MPGHLRPNVDGEPTVPAGEQCLELLAVLSAMASDQERAQSSLDPVLQTRLQDVEMAGGDAHGIGQLGAFEAVTELELQQGQISFLE